MTHKLPFGLVLTVVLAAWHHSAWAMDDTNKEAIRGLSNQASADYEQGHYDAARDKFSRAYAIAKVPKLAVWAARANEKLGKLVAAYELYRQALGLQPNDLWSADVQQLAQKDAQDELGKLQPRIPRLTVVLDGANADDVALKVDNVDVPSALIGVERFADAGQRQIVAKRGGEVVNETVTLAEGEKKQVVLKFGKSATLVPGASRSTAQDYGSVPGKTTSEISKSGPSAQPAYDPPTSRSNSQRTWGWIGVGVGAAGVALGAATGLMVALQYGDLNSKCPNRDQCNPKYQSEVDTYHTLRTLSPVGFIVGGIAAAAGVTLLLTSPKEKPPANVGLWLSPNAAGVIGDF